MTHEFAKRYRPTTLEEVVGQPEAVRILSTMLANTTVPHALLFSGASGCGKTTMARIMARELGCGKQDFFEVNGAEARGIDDMRAIQSRMGLAPIAGKVRVWLIDEAHQLGRAAMESMLKPFEDTPKHVYFMLCTTEPAKIIATIKNRCTEIKVKPVAAAVIKARVIAVTDAEEVEIEETIAARIAEIADGSLRRSLVLLEQIIGLPAAEQMAALQAADFKTAGIDVARALFNRGTTWAAMAAIIKALEVDAAGLESVRHAVMGYASAILLNGKTDDRAFLIIDAFKKPWYDCGRNGLVAAAYEIITSKK